MTTATLDLPAEQHIVLDDISWETYEALLKGVGERHIRLTYDNGRLEIMTMSLEHESSGRWIGRLIGALTIELDLPLRSGGSTTLKRKLKKKGLEPDECFWIQNEKRIRGKRKFQVRTDPPPDLAVEVDVTNSSLDRMPIYAAFKIPEIWRFVKGRLRVYQLRKGKYQEVDQSPTFPFLPLDKLTEFIHLSADQDENTVWRAFVRWLRTDIIPKLAAPKNNKSARTNGKT